jgi:hypothetical protein
MNKFCKHLRGQRKSVPCVHNGGHFRPRGLMTGVLDNFGRDDFPASFFPAGLAGIGVAGGLSRVKTML